MEKYSKDSRIVYNNEWLIEEIGRKAAENGIKFNQITLKEKFRGSTMTGIQPQVLM